MQLGTRWSAGDTPPAAVPASLHAQLKAVEADLPAGPAPRWTLTWLEGRPVAELDTGVIVTLDRDGSVVVRHDDDDEFG
ncbi:hypothetical protein [Microbacterium candidum]|uniref:Fe-S oxidoreductase n=1 Tax=Microbacterium candidum TaxID=3041922 RepID=A0ABT7MYQ8_9MICO|nr:hypothetical protein [Microbacterium sp. ASV49]MDL9979588.1 hypothetical protein [Microbacterium sp. ASV49]